MNKETLSQLLDGELSHQEMETILDALLGSTELQKSWKNMHTMRDALDDHTKLAPAHLSDKISALLEAESPIMAPNNILLEADSNVGIDMSSNNVVAIKTKRTNIMTYLAVAASVAALAMLAYNPSNNQPEPSIASNQSSSTTISQPDVGREIQSMIVQHGEFSGAAALNGLVAYAKVVNGSTVPSGQ